MAPCSRRRRRRLTDVRSRVCRADVACTLKTVGQSVGGPWVGVSRLCGGGSNGRQCTTDMYNVTLVLYCHVMVVYAVVVAVASSRLDAGAPCSSLVVCMDILFRYLIYDQLIASRTNCHIDSRTCIKFCKQFQTSLLVTHASK